MWGGAIREIVTCEGVHECRIHSFFGEHVQQLFQRLIDSGESGKDCSMIIKLIDGSLESAN